MASAVQVNDLFFFLEFARFSGPGDLSSPGMGFAGAEGEGWDLRTCSGALNWPYRGCEFCDEECHAAWVCGLELASQLVP